jgi:hypothetical protein
MGDPYTQEHAEPEKQRVDAGRRRMIWLDTSDPEGAYDALMALVDESNSRQENEHADTEHLGHHEP